ncbi:hypothetical protein [Halostella sp. PRR32]|uniref:hypothetical protein n=1 Tax=Halostella sp. PRR32 TaxID=3098147 RepID=UPI002B1D2062|nr:hypothetical protein [Halostella sp. PRR32]
MNRRRYLGSAASALGIAVAGCLDQAGSASDDTNDSDDETTPDETTFAGVEVGNVRATPELVAMNTPDSIGTFGDSDEQYVVATVSAEGSSAPEYGAFELDAGGTTHSPDEDAGGMNGHLWTFESPYQTRFGSNDSTEGWIAFTVPKPLDGESAAITWPGGGRSLDSDAVDYLARPPTEFEIREFTAPDSVEVGEEATVSGTVENVGDVDGTFVAARNRSGPWVAYTPDGALSIDVPAGETATWERSHTVDERHLDREDGDNLSMRFHLRCRSDDLTRKVNVEI